MSAIKTKITRHTKSQENLIYNEKNNQNQPGTDTDVRISREVHLNSYDYILYVQKLSREMENTSNSQIELLEMKSLMLEIKIQCTIVIAGIQEEKKGK